MGLFDRRKGEGQGETPAGDAGAKRAELDTALRQAQAGGDPELIELVELEIKELEARGENGEVA